MSTPYTGNPSGGPNSSPSPVPGPGVAATVNIPADTDPNNSATMFQQQYETLADHLAWVNKASFPCLPALAANGTGFTAVAHTFGAGTGTVTPSGSVKISSGLSFVVKIIVAGATGTATFQTSMDGGTTFGATQTTAASMTDATSGITLAFAGTFTTFDVYAWQSAMTPQAQWKNTAGKTRFLMDHNGYPTGGRISTLDEQWGWGSGALSNGVQTGTMWTATLAAGSGVSILAPSAAYNSRYIQITPSSTSGLQTLLYSAPFAYANTSQMSLVLEFEVGLSVAGVSSNVSWYVGLETGTNPNSDNSIIMLNKPYAAANWAIAAGNGSTTAVTDAGVAPLVFGYPADRIRIELHGNTSPLGAYGAIFFINEVLVGFSTHIPTGTLRLMVASSNDGGVPSGSPLGYVGPIHQTWNRYSSISL